MGASVAMVVVPDLVQLDVVVGAGSELDSKGVKRKTIGEQISELWKQQQSDFESWGTPVADDGRKVAWLSPMPADVVGYFSLDLIRCVEFVANRVSMFANQEHSGNHMKS